METDLMHPPANAVDQGFIGQMTGLKRITVFFNKMPWIYHPGGFPSTRSRSNWVSRAEVLKINALKEFASQISGTEKLWKRTDAVSVIARNLLCGMLATGAALHGGSKKLVPADWHLKVMRQANLRRNLPLHRGAVATVPFEKVFAKLRECVHDPAQLGHQATGELHMVSGKELANLSRHSQSRMPKRRK